MLKKILTILFILYWGLNSEAQNIIFGKDTLPNHNESKNYSFKLKDKNKNYWLGFGGVGKNNSVNGGLLKFDTLNNVWDYVTTKGGAFTCVIEIGNELFFTSTNGIQKYNGVKFILLDSIINQTCIINWGSKIIIGTNGNGLYELTNNSFFKIPIVINGTNHDSIYCLETEGSNLLIGTSNGLFKYDGSTFKKYNLPIKKTKNIKQTQLQNEVIHLKKDNDGKIWVKSRNVIDSVHSLFIFQNENFIRAIDYYNHECVLKYLIPYNKEFLLELDYKGNLNVNGLTFMKESIYNYYKHKEPVDYSDWIYLSKIETNDIKSTTGNTGFNTYFLDAFMPELNLPRFSVPSIACAPLIFASSIWMGGENTSNNNLHLAAETYRQGGRDYKPGPIDLTTFVNDTANTNFYNRIWKISQKTIDEFLQNRTNSGYQIPKIILEWPAHGRGNFAYNLAPYVDIDSNNIYEPTNGDYPKIKGDEFQWWVFNDLGFHSESNSFPLGVEVHGSCYAFKDIRLTNTDSNYIINRTLFFNYKIINRSQNDYKNFYISAWGDYNIGNYYDDYIGCDTINNASFAYNNDNIDENLDGFGKNPPIIFCKLLNHNMTNFMYYENNFSPQRGNPNAPTDYYNYLKSNWQNGRKITYGGNGDSGTSETNYIFTGKICENKGWTETTGNNPTGNRRSLTTTNMPILKKDSIFSFEFAYTVLHNPNIDWLKDGCDIPSKTLQKIQQWYDSNSFPSKPFYGLKNENIVGQRNGFILFPNPTNDLLNIQSFDKDNTINAITIYTNIGKILLNENSNESTKAINISYFPSGIYIVKVNTKNGVFYKSFIKD